MVARALVGRVAPVLAILVAAVAATPAHAASGPNPIQLENAKPGTAAWDLPGGTPTRGPRPSQHIEGYTSEISVQPGGTIHFHISTMPAAAYRIEIYRLGWYGGLGGRLIACLPSCTSSNGGVRQASTKPDPTTGLLDAGWPVTDTIAVGGGWTTGYYEAKLILTSGVYSGQASRIVFIVRSPPGGRSAVLVQVPVNTWEAYNNWGGKSLYTFNSSGPSVPASGSIEAAMVSFNRPYANVDDPFIYEYNTLRWLERMGYDLSYQTDVDTDTNPASLLSHRLDVVSGHDEYWSPAMRDAWEAARAAGVNLAFLGGNIGFWQARLASGDRTLIEYRSASLDPDPDPATKTVQFASPPVNRPECSLLGIGRGGLAHTGDPPRSDAATSAATTHPWFAGTGFAAGQTITDSVGYEWDQIIPGCAVPPLTDLLHYNGLTGVPGASPAPADAVTYTAPSGAQVFSDGSFQIDWALDSYGHPSHVDPRVQRLYANIFAALGGAPGPGLASDFGNLAPSNGTVTGSPVTFRWSAPATTFASAVVFVDGVPRTTLAAAACPAGLCRASVPLPAGPHTWSVTAADALGNTTRSPSISFTVDTTPPAPFRLRRPAARAVLWNPMPTLAWRAARDSVGIADYVVLVDGRPVATTRRLALRLARPLADGHHAWAVIAVDRVGNRRRSATRRFTIRSVRLAHASPAARLAHGLRLEVFCTHRCRIAIRAARDGRRRVAILVRGISRGGIASVVVRLPTSLLPRRGARLRLLVRVTSPGDERSVRLTAFW